MSENDIDVDNPEFIKHIGFLVEVVKSTIYQDMGVKHPMQQLVDLFVNSDYDETQGLYTEFDMGTMKDVIEELIGDEEKELVGDRNKGIGNDMILIDMNQVCISNLMMQIGSKDRMM